MAKARVVKVPRTPVIDLASRRDRRALSAAPRPSPSNCAVINLPSAMTELERATAVVMAMEIAPIDFHAQLLGVAYRRRYSPGWAAINFKRKFEVWPNELSAENAFPAPCGPEILAWADAMKADYRKRRAEIDAERSAKAEAESRAWKAERADAAARKAGMAVQNTKPSVDS